jgi:hypothetical protein
MTLVDWLSAEDRVPPLSAAFVTRDVQEARPVAEAERDALARAAVESRTAPEFLRTVAAELGSALVERRVAQADNSSVARGDFGEVLTMLRLRDDLGLVTPWSKLRVKILSGQTMPGCDIMCFQADADTLMRLHLTEVKLRTTRELKAGAAAYTQHARRSASEIEEQLIFTLSELWRDGSPYFDQLRELLRTRQGEGPNDAHEIVALYELSAWDDAILTRVDEVAGALEDTRVHAVRIADLRALSDDVLGRAGLQVIDDPEDVADV